MLFKGVVPIHAFNMRVNTINKLP